MLDGRTDLTDPQLNDWINQAYSHVSQPEVRRHRQLEAVYDITLVTGQSVYAVDASTVGFEILDIDDVTFYDATTITTTAVKRPVHPIELQELNRQTITQVVGGPSRFVWYEEEIRFNYAAAAGDNGKQVRLDVLREPAQLSLDSDQTVLGNYWDRAIELGARWLAQEDLYGVEFAFGAMQQYVSWINEKKDITKYGAMDTRRNAGVRSEAYQ